MTTRYPPALRSVSRFLFPLPSTGAPRRRPSRAPLTFLLSALVVLVAPGGGSATVVLDGVDRSVAPPGSAISLTGSGLADTTSVTLFSVGWVAPAPFSVVTDGSLAVTLPDLVNLPHQILVETESGSTATLADDIVEVLPGMTPETRRVRNLIVRAGAVLAGNYTNLVIHVETGGVVELAGDTSALVILVQDGAVLDLSGILDFIPFLAKVYHSPGATIVPPPEGMPFEDGFIREVPSLSWTRDLGPFSLGWPIDVDVVGGGSVVRDPDFEFYNRGEDVFLTAVAEPGHVFAGWSGDVVSAESRIRVGTDDRTTSLTATFTAGFTVTVHATPGGSVDLDPDQAIWNEGERATFTATADPGYVFEGWQGDLVATGSPAELVVDGSKTVTAYFRPEGFDQAPRIDAADRHVVPEGERITLTGSGLAGVTGVWLVHERDRTPVEFTILDGASIEVVMPDLGSSARFVHRLYVESPQGATFTLLSDDPAHTVENGASAGPRPGEVLVVKPGAALTAPDGTIYVEGGATLELTPEDRNPTVFAEDGATVRFAFPEEQAFLGQLFHSPGAVLLDAPPDPHPEAMIVPIPRLRPSPGLPDGFSEAAILDLVVVGDGTVAADPPGTWHRPGTEIVLTAEAADGAQFVGWSGLETSTALDLRIRLFDSGTLTATFARGWIFETFAAPGGTVVRGPAKDAYDDGEAVTLTAEPAAGYVFERWSGDAAGSDPEIVMTLTGNRHATAHFREEGFEFLPQVSGADRHDAVPGEIITVTGSGLGDATGAWFLAAGTAVEAEIVVLDPETLAVTMPAFDVVRDPHRLLVTTTSGSTSLLFANDTVVEPVGPSDARDAWPRGMIVRPGAVLEGGGIGLVHVEPGGRFVLDGAGGGLTVVAEDGAVIEFDRFDGLRFEALVLRSPGTLLEGEVPDEDDLGGTIGEIRAIPSLRPSRGLQPFRQAMPVDVQVEGPGSVMLDPDRASFVHGESVTLTAVPAEGAHFIRWLGDSTARAPEITIAVRRPLSVTARFSERPDFYITWRNAHFTPAELLDPFISGLSADPDSDRFSNAAEYALGTDPRGADADGRALEISRRFEDGRHRLFLEYVRPSGAADVEYLIEVTTDLLTWHRNGDGTSTVYTRERGTRPTAEERLERVTVELFPESAELPRLLLVRIDALVDLTP